MRSWSELGFLYIEAISFETMQILVRRASFTFCSFNHFGLFLVKKMAYSVVSYALNAIILWLSIHTWWRYKNAVNIYSVWESNPDLGWNQVLREKIIKEVKVVLKWLELLGIESGKVESNEALFRVWLMQWIRWDFLSRVVWGNCYLT